MRCGFLTASAALLVVALFLVSPVGPNGARAAETPPAAASQAGAQPAGEKPTTVEQRRLLYSLQEERERLQSEYRHRAEDLDQQEIALKTLAAEVDKKIAELQKLQEEVQKLLVEKDAVEAKRIKSLSRMYEKMDPAQAAQLLANLDQDLAVGILKGMNPKAGAQIMDNLPAKKAASLSVAFSSPGKS